MNLVLFDLVPEEWLSVPKRIRNDLAILLGDNYDDVVEGTGIISEHHFTIVNGKYTLPTWPKFGEFDTIDEARYEAESYAAGLLEKHYEEEIDYQHYRRYGRHED